MIYIVAFGGGLKIHFNTEWGEGQILADQLTLSEPGGADYAHHINTGSPGFSDLPTALSYKSLMQQSASRKV